jgi:hypothetical protein
MEVSYISGEWTSGTYFVQMTKRHDFKSSSYGMWCHVLLWQDINNSEVHFYGWRWRQYGTLKRFYPTTILHGVTIQKTLIWIFIAVKTSNFIVSSLRCGVFAKKEVRFFYVRTFLYWNTFRHMLPATGESGSQCYPGISSVTIGKTESVSCQRQIYECGTTESNCKWVNLFLRNIAITEFKKGYRRRINIIKDENYNLLADPQSVLKRWKNFFNQVLNGYGVHDVRRMVIQTAEPLVPELSLSSGNSYWKVETL